MYWAIRLSLFAECSQLEYTHQLLTTKMLITLIAFCVVLTVLKLCNWQQILQHCHCLDPRRLRASDFAFSFAFTSLKLSWSWFGCSWLAIGDKNNSLHICVGCLRLARCGVLTYPLISDFTMLSLSGSVPVSGFQFCLQLCVDIYKAQLKLIWLLAGFWWRQRQLAYLSGSTTVAVFQFRLQLCIYIYKAQLKLIGWLLMITTTVARRWCRSSFGILAPPFTTNFARPFYLDWLQSSMMAETSCSTTLCSTLTKEWFEDSSSEEEDKSVSNHCRHVWLFKKGKTSTLGRRSDLLKEKDLIVEVKVAVKIELKVASKAVLTAKVHGGLKNGSLTSAVSTLAPFSQKGKGKAKNNWRERPVCARPHGSFQRTLPGELSRAIFWREWTMDSPFRWRKTPCLCRMLQLTKPWKLMLLTAAVFLNRRQEQGRESLLQGR